MKILGIGMIGIGIAIILGVAKAKQLMKNIETDYNERLLELEDENKKYKKLVNDVKIKLSDCQGTQFYNNTNLALRKVSQIITEFENTNY